MRKAVIISIQFIRNSFTLEPDLFSSLTEAAVQRCSKEKVF